MPHPTKREEAGRQVTVLDDMFEKDPDGNLHGHLGVAGSESVAGCANRFATSLFTTLTDTPASPLSLPIQCTSVILVNLHPTTRPMVPLLRLSHAAAWRELVLTPPYYSILCSRQWIRYAPVIHQAGKQARNRGRNECRNRGIPSYTPSFHVTNGRPQCSVWSDRYSPAAHLTPPHLICIPLTSPQTISYPATPKAHRDSTKRAAGILLRLRIRYGTCTLPSSLYSTRTQV